MWNPLQAIRILVRTQAPVLMNTVRPFSASPIYLRRKDLSSLRGALMPEEEGVTGEKLVTVSPNLPMYPTLETHLQVFDGMVYTDVPIIHIKCSQNNTIMSIVDAKLNKITDFCTCGTEGFKNCKKGTNVAGQAVGLSLGKKAVARGQRTFRVAVRGLGPGRASSIKEILHTVAKLTDQTCIVRITPHRFYVFTKPALTDGGWFISAEVRPDMLFDEFQMSGYDPDRQDTNEIYVEIKAGILMQSLKIPSINAKFVKIRLINKAGPCMSIEAELPSQAPSSRRTVFDVPIKIIHRLLWPDTTPPEQLEFSSSCYLPMFKIFKGVIDHMRALGQSVEVAMNQEGELKLHIGDAADGYSVNSHFQGLEIPPDANITNNNYQRDEGEEEVLAGSSGFFKVTVDIRQLYSFLGALQFQSTPMRCDLRHRRFLVITLGAEDFRMRYMIPSIDV